MPASRWFIAALSLTALIGCGQGKSATVESAADTATEVTVACPVQKSIRYIVEQPGRIEPFEQTPIYARISGYVRAVNVQTGDRVKKGDVLVEMEVPELVAAHSRKAALVVQARLGIKQAEQAIQVAEASVASARAAIEVSQAALAKAVAALERWRSEYQRMERLVKDKIVDPQSRDEVRNQFRAAEASKAEAEATIRAGESGLAEAVARRDKTQTDRDAAHNQLAVAEADEREAKAYVDYARITAPYDGVIAERRVHTGWLPSGDAGGTTGKPLLVMLRIDKVRVFVAVPEADAIQVHDSSPGRIRVHALKDREFTGNVAGTSWSLDPSQRTLLTEIDFANPDGMLRPGMYVHALIDVERTNVWMVPESAVMIRDGISFCYQVRGGKALCLPVKLGLRDCNCVEVSKFQEPPRSPGQGAAWANPTGKESIVTTKAGELIDNQAVSASEGK